MPDPMQLDPDRLRVALDHGEVVELDGGTLVLDGQESPSVVLRLAPWRARSVARVLQEWTSVSRIFHHSTRLHLEDWICHGRWSWPLQCSVAVMSRSCGPLAAHVSSPTGNAWPPWQSWGEREAHLSAVQRLALVDAAAWWLSEPNGGEEFAYALLAASCTAEVTTEHVYLALITPPDEPYDDGGAPSS
jgi:hypothetical protein